MNFRFCVLTAVSSENQVEDRDSLDYQLISARGYGERMGGEFTMEFRIDGYSRTGYFDLTRAFDDIPPLKEMSLHIYKKLADVVIVESYDRLGSVAFAFWEWLKPLRVQFRAAQQALPIEQPASYDPRRDDATLNMIATSMMVQNYRINKIVRAFAVGNPRRAREGHYSNRPPEGYIIRRDRKPSYTVQDVTVCAVLARWPDWFLVEGCTYAEIARRTEQILQRGKRKTEGTVRRQLENPFYAGKTFYGRYKDPDTQLYDGKQEPVWSYETHLKILDEIERRQGKGRAVYNFSGLLECSVCGVPLGAIIAQPSTKAHRVTEYRGWYCKQCKYAIRMEDAERMVTDGMVRLLQDYTYTPKSEEERKDYTRRQITKVDSQIRREREAFDAGAYEPLEYAEIVKQLKARKAELEDAARQEAEDKRKMAERERTYSTMQEILPHLGEWIAQGPPEQVRYHLSRSVKLTASPDRTIGAELFD